MTLLPISFDALNKTVLQGKTSIHSLDMCTGKRKIDLSTYPLGKDFMEMCPGKDPYDGMMLQLAETLPDPRTIKLHLPFSLLAPSLLHTVKVSYALKNLSLLTSLEILL